MFWDKKQHHDHRWHSWTSETYCHIERDGLEVGGAFRYRYCVDCWQYQVNVPYGVITGTIPERHQANVHQFLELAFHPNHGFGHPDADEAYRLHQEVRLTEQLSRVRGMLEEGVDWIKELTLRDWASQQTEDVSIKGQ